MSMSITSTAVSPGRTSAKFGRRVALLILVAMALFASCGTKTELSTSVPESGPDAEETDSPDPDAQPDDDANESLLREVQDEPGMEPNPPQRVPDESDESGEAPIAEPDVLPVEPESPELVEPGPEDAPRDPDDVEPPVDPEPTPEPVEVPANLQAMCTPLEELLGSGADDPETPQETQAMLEDMVRLTAEVTVEAPDEYAQAAATLQAWVQRIHDAAETVDWNPDVLDEVADNLEPTDEEFEIIESLLFEATETCGIDF